MDAARWMCCRGNSLTGYAGSNTSKCACYFKSLTLKKHQERYTIQGELGGGLDHSYVYGYSTRIGLNCTAVYMGVNVLHCLQGQVSWYPPIPSQNMALVH